MSPSARTIYQSTSTVLAVTAVKASIPPTLPCASPTSRRGLVVTCQDERSQQQKPHTGACRFAGTALGNGAA